RLLLLIPLSAGDRCCYLVVAQQMSRSSFSPLTCKSVMWKASWTSYKNSRASSMTVLLGVKPVHISWTLLLDSRVLRDQELNERRQQRFASLADVVHELKEPQVEREFLLGNTPMRTQPTAQQGPEAFHGIHMHFTHAVPIVIAGELASPMVDALMVVSPRIQADINTVRICVHPFPWINGVCDERLDGLLLHIGQQLDHHLTATLNHPKDGWSCLL